MVTERVNFSSSSSSSLVSMRVVTWFSVSVIVAPGSEALITMTLTVKFGSSSRPRRR